MNRTPLRRGRAWAWSLFIASTVGVGAVAVAACSDDETSPPAAGPDGSTADFDSGSTPPPTPPTTDGSAPTPADAGSDAEVVADGGDLPPEDDAGTTDPDAGVDAGPACATLTTGGFVTSTCASRLVVLGGGELTTTNYQLESVTVLGSPAFCADGGGFAPYNHRGALEVTATSPSTATFEFYNQYAKAPSGGIIVKPSYTAERYDVTVTGKGSTLTYSPQACAAKTAPPSASYHVGVNKLQKKTLTLQLPYGKGGSARYLFVEQ